MLTWFSAWEGKNGDLRSWPNTELTYLWKKKKHNNWHNPTLEKVTRDLYLILCQQVRRITFDLDLTQCWPVWGGRWAPRISWWPWRAARARCRARSLRSPPWRRWRWRSTRPGRGWGGDVRLAGSAGCRTRWGRGAGRLAGCLVCVCVGGGGRVPVM